MRCLLTNPISKVSPYSISVDPVISRHVGGKTKTGAWSPIGLGYVAALIRTGGFEVEILDPVPQGYTYRAVLEKAKQFDCIFCTLAPENEEDMFNLYKELTNKTRIFLGTYATAISQTLLKNDYCDIVIRGEPEITSLDVVKNIDNLHSVKGISFRENGQIVNNIDRELIDDLDSLPFPARDLIDNDLYTHLSFLGESVGLILTSRGCPFNCCFCTTHLFYGRKWRARSPENVIAELEEMVVRYNLKHIIFMDDTFPIDQERVCRICDGIIKRGLEIEWSCLARPDKAITEKMLRKMKEAGCVEIRYGVESGVQHVLDTMGKDLQLEQIEKAARLTKKVGIKMLCFFMIGNQGENQETIRQTVRFAKKLNPDFATFSIAMPYPGSKLFDEFTAKKSDLLGHENWNFSVCELTVAALQKELKRAYFSFYFRPKYLMKVARDFVSNISEAPMVIRAYWLTFRSM